MCFKLGNFWGFDHDISSTRTTVKLEKYILFDGEVVYRFGQNYSKYKNYEKNLNELLDSLKSLKVNDI